MRLFELNKYFGKRGKYTEPKNDEISNLKDLIDILILEKKNCLKSINFLNLTKKLKLKIVELDDKPRNYAFYDDSVGSMFIVWNFDSTNSKSVLVYTHAGSDNVNNFVLNQYLLGGHKCMVINGWSISSTKKKSLTSNRTKVNADHSYDNLMNYFVHYINLKDPSLVFINLHGMITDAERNLWTINSMSRYNYSIKNYPVLLLIAFLVRFPSIKIQTTVELSRFTLGGKPIKLLGFSKVGPTSSVIGRIIHSKSMDPKESIIDTGNYVHMEHSIGFANKINNSKDVAEAHSIALNYYKTWDNDKHSLKNAPVALEQFEEWLFKKDD